MGFFYFSLKDKKKNIFRNNLYYLNERQRKQKDIRHRTKTIITKTQDRQ